MRLMLSTGKEMISKKKTLKILQNRKHPIRSQHLPMLHYHVSQQNSLSDSTLARWYYPLPDQIYLCYMFTLLSDLFKHQEQA